MNSAEKEKKSGIQIMKCQENISDNKRDFI